MVTMNVKNDATAPHPNLFRISTSIPPLCVLVTHTHTHTHRPSLSLSVCFSLYVCMSLSVSECLLFSLLFALKVYAFFKAVFVALLEKRKITYQSMSIYLHHCDIVWILNWFFFLLCWLTHFSSHFALSFSLFFFFSFMASC
uniref:Uncharacterized protein n=1 Tax=Trypanosoma vivax (strain Y486) TaxID=1055687 RepID=G0TWJ3_TRYVY|nr:hypothetical protein TVY486_0601220 [Trypanosoma vivax Y486]